MLSQAQLAQYDRDGYVMVSGLIPEETIAAAEAAMWSVLGMDRDDPASWSPLPDNADGVTTVASQGVVEQFGLKDPALMACYTPAFYEAQSQLARKNEDAFHCRRPRPESVWARSVFPVVGKLESPQRACRWRTSTVQHLSRIIPRFVADVSRFRCRAGWRNGSLAGFASHAQRWGGAGSRQVSHAAGFTEPNAKVRSERADRVDAVPGRRPVLSLPAGTRRVSQYRQQTAFRNPMDVYLRPLPHLGKARQVEYLDAVKLDVLSYPFSSINASYSASGCVIDSSISVTANRTCTVRSSPTRKSSPNSER